MSATVAMSTEHTNRILNRALTVHARSLPAYLHFAQPHMMRGDEKAKSTLAQIVGDQQAVVDRLGTMILDNGGTTKVAHFPISWTAYNDLGYDFLIGKMIENQVLDIVELEACAKELPSTSVGGALIEESLGQAKAHLELLQELNA